uniref:Putative isomerase BH0283-like n=1 Tax=Rhizophora mucronata TaxID=61149 RepID=A0A2P2JCS1_RHIMU
MDRKPVNYFVVDAFTDSAFKGNPAAVCLLEEERDEKWLQAVAVEFNLSETCYLTPISLSDDHQSSRPRFRLRYFTPVDEVKLCGHATLAASHTLFTRGLVGSSIIEFDTLSGILTATKIPEIKKAHASSNRNGEAKESFLIELDFPIVPTTECNSIDVAPISEALNGASIIDIKSTTTANDLFVVLPSGEAVKEIRPQFDKILKCPGTGIIASAAAPPDSGFDFYSRFFCPKLGVNEVNISLMRNVLLKFKEMCSKQVN